MNTDIYSGKPGRAIGNYDLLTEIMDKYSLERREAHGSVVAFLDQIVAIDGEGTIIASTPVRPELLVSNPHDLDIDYWLTVSDETADSIREAFSAAYVEAGPSVTPLDDIVREMADLYGIDLAAARIDVATYADQCDPEDRDYDIDGGDALTEGGVQLVRSRMASVYA